jgi:hypothetical protein
MHIRDSKDREEKACWEIKKDRRHSGQRYTQTELKWTRWTEKRTCPGLIKGKKSSNLKV